MDTPSTAFTVAAAKAKFDRIERPAIIEPGVTKLSADIFARGDFELRYYAPGDVDHQVPHNKDEVYIVIAGTSTLECEDTTHPCTAGDALFVPKGMTHRFVGSSADFAVWVMFF